MWTTDWTPPVTGTFFAAVRVEGGNPSTVGTRVLFVYISPNTKQLRRSEGWNLQAWRYYLLKLLPLHAFETKHPCQTQGSPIKRHDLVMIGTHKTSYPVSPWLPGISRLNTMGMTSFRFCLCFQKTSRSRRFGDKTRGENRDLNPKKMKGGLEWRNVMKYHGMPQQMDWSSLWQLWLSAFPWISVVWG